MARILVTGMTAKQRGGGRPSMFLLLDAVTLALESLGHSVAREVRLSVDDDLSEYDYAIVGLYALDSASASPQKIQCVKACTQLPHVVAWDDWHSKQVFGSIRKWEKSFWRGGMHESDQKFQIEREKALRGHGAQIVARIAQWAEKIPACLTAAFNWGDHSILREQHAFGSLLPWDPTPWIAGWYDCPVKRVKERSWSLASLSQQEGWLDDLRLAWPTQRMFSPTAGARGWQISEQEVFDTYCRTWGVLSPPYDHLLGSGWWRNRFALSTLADSVLWCDPAELNLKESWFFTPASLVESMTDEQLTDLASKQKEELWTKWVISKDQSAQQLWDWLSRNWQS